MIEQNGYDAKDTDIQYVERDMDLNGSPEFADNWMNDGSVTGAEFKMTLTCKNLVAVIKDSGSSEFGTADILVDGNVVKQINPLDNGWAHCNPQILIDEKESKTRKNIRVMHLSCTTLYTRRLHNSIHDACIELYSLSA